MKRFRVPIRTETVEIGHDSDTTLSRSAAGRLAVEGVNIPSISSSDIFTNKSISGSNNTLTNIPPSARTGGFHIGVISASTLSTTGNKAITGLGFTPKMVRFVSLTSGTGAVSFGTGAMTPSAQYYEWIIADSASGRSRNSGTDAAIAAAGTTGTLGLKAAFVSMDADGFTINVSTASTPGDWVFEAYG